MSLVKKSGYSMWLNTVTLFFSVTSPFILCRAVKILCFRAIFCILQLYFFLSELSFSLLTFHKFWSLESHFLTFRLIWIFLKAFPYSIYTKAEFILWWYKFSVSQTMSTFFFLSNVTCNTLLNALVHSCYSIKFA